MSGFRFNGWSDELDRQDELKRSARCPHATQDPFTIGVTVARGISMNIRFAGANAADTNEIARVIAWLTGSHIDRAADSVATQRSKPRASY